MPLLARWNMRYLVALLLICLPAGAPGVAAVDDQVQAALIGLQAKDARVAAIAFRLATANLPLCSVRAPQSGMILHDSAQYRQDFRPAAIRAFDLGEGPSILAVVPGGPAAVAGLRVGDRLISVDGVPFAPADAATRKGSYAGLEQAARMLDTALARGRVAIDAWRGDAAVHAVVVPVPGCASRVQLLPSDSYDSGADGSLITITTALMDFARDDDELAMIIGHEMAHNVLGHRAILAGAGIKGGLSSHFGKAAARIRATEMEADRWGAFFAARAGYAADAGPRFFARFGRSHGLGVLTDPTHPTEAQRVRALTQTVMEIQQLAAQGREIVPATNFDTKH